MLTRYRTNLEIFISPGMEEKSDKDDQDQEDVIKRIGPPDPPAGRPVAVSDPSGGLSAVLTWSSPPYDGGRCVDGYVVEGKTESETEWRVVAERCHSLSVVVRDLAAGRRHVFRVRAENVHGVSEPSAQSLPYCTPTLTESTDEPPPPPFAPRLVSVEPMEGPTSFASRFELLEELGKGRYGIVHRVTERATGHVLAAKLIRTIKAKDRQQVHDEIAIMNILRHPKLLQLAAAFEGPREMIMVMEYISGGELFERVVADDFTLTERDCILFMRQICEGVEYMHQNQVVHLDLKPENIMCQTRTSHQIKLIDFGLAQKLKPDTPVRVLFGTPEFIPPEIINYEPIGTESDMWSVGVICYVLLSGLSPFMGDNDAETFANITRADFDFDDEAFDAISQDAKDFISALLVKRKEKRLTARQCLEHPWLAQQPANMSCIALSTDKLKKFIIRRKWQKTGNAIRALGRMATLSAASRRNSAASSSPGTPRQSIASPVGSPLLPRSASLSKDDSVEEVLEDSPVTPAVSASAAALAAAAAATPTRLADTLEEDEDPTVPESTPPPAEADAVGAVVEEAVTATLLPRGRFRSERSDSGISDCSSASSRNLPAPASSALLGKKFSISEEADESPLPEPPVVVATSPAARPSHLPLHANAALRSPAAVNPSAPTPSVTVAPPVTQSTRATAHDGMSTVSRRSAELLQKLASNSSGHSSPAPAAAPAAAATAAVGGVAAAAAAERKVAGYAPHKAAGVRPTNGLRSPTKTRVGFVESKIKSLESQSSSGSLHGKVSIQVVPPKERTSLRDTWRDRTASPGRVASPSRNNREQPAVSPSRANRLPVSPSRTEVILSGSRRDALSPNRKESVLSRREEGLSPSRRVTATSPTRQEALSRPGNRLTGRTSSSPSRTTAYSPSRKPAEARSPSRRTTTTSSSSLSPSSPDSPMRNNRLMPLSPTATLPRKAPLDTGLQRKTQPNSVDSPPKSPTLRRMIGPNKLGAHSVGFQKTLEFWKR